jgi:hypothetical protein
VFPDLKTIGLPFLQFRVPILPKLGILSHDKILFIYWRFRSCVCSRWLNKSETFINICIVKSCEVRPCNKHSKDFAKRFGEITRRWNWPKTDQPIFFGMLKNLICWSDGAAAASVQREITETRNGFLGP